MTLDYLDHRNKIHVSFDIDAMDRTFAPSTGTVVPGGLTLREGLVLAEALRETKRIQGIDLVEFNPELGSEANVERTSETVITIIKTLCGFKRSGSYGSNIDLKTLNLG